MPGLRALTGKRVLLASSATAVALALFLPTSGARAETTPPSPAETSIRPFKFRASAEDLADLKTHAGHKVKMTGELKGDSITVSKIDMQ